MSGEGAGQFHRAIPERGDAAAAAEVAAPQESISGPFSGGCQCGAIRFRAERLKRASICHCRMCQKAVGGPIGAYVIPDGFVITRGVLKHFRSSNKVRRGFCGDCGTPLTVPFSEPVLAMRLRSRIW